MFQVIKQLMGGIESQFSTLLVEGKAEEALQMWNKNFELQIKYQPNTRIKASPYRDTPLHCTVRFEMKELMQEFLSMGADPFAQNSLGETPLHMVCRAAKCSSRRAKKRAEFLQMMLDRIPTEENFEVIRSSASLERGCGLEKGLSHSVKEREKKLLNGESEGGGPIKTTADSDAHFLGTQDKSRNTPLHLAAASGLLECVELLVAHDAPLFVHNVAGQTPCDVAWEAKEIVIAKQLESKMVLGAIGGDMLQDRASAELKRTRNKSFHNTRTLKKLKEDIVARVAQRLGVPDQSAQALLMSYGWSEELLIDAWHSDREAACEKAGIGADMVDQLNDLDTNAELFYEANDLNAPTPEQECGICYCEIQPHELTYVPCQHKFCRECWRMYIDSQINEGGGKEIRCPEVDCFRIVPDEVIASLISEGQMERYTELTIKQFVDSSADIRWCPYPDCGYAICMKKEDMKERGGAVGGAGEVGRSKKEESTKGGATGSTTGGGGAVGGATKEDSKEDSTEGGGAVGGATEEELTCGENVECGQGHGFCWNCMKDPHEPCSCELWAKWKEIVISNMSEEDRSRVAGEAQANAQWIIRNTKPCPNCKSPIQKNEGCNHMTCKTCQHDFCWVCLDPWNIHSHRTGGYFTCNRWGAQAKADKVVKKMQSTLEREYVHKAYKELEDQQEKFEHYHDRYNNHLQSLGIEMKLLQESKDKLREMERLGHALDKKVALVKAKVLMDTVEFADEACRSFPNLKGKNFLDNIFRALLHARRVLAASYCIGYFLPDEKKEAKRAHESLQGKLEVSVETLSQMVNREYLLKTQQELSVAAGNVETLCEKYLSEMKEVAAIAGRFVMGIEDEEQKKARLAREERRRLEEQRAEEERVPPTLEELLFFEHLIRLMDGNGRLHVLVPPPAANGQ